MNKLRHCKVRRQVGFKKEILWLFSFVYLTIYYGKGEKLPKKIAVTYSNSTSKMQYGVALLKEKDKHSYHNIELSLY